tara:strand:+ start:3531 stop:4259 length:729 start_codon:yes stop_codon:yes gene_type:complete
LKKTETRSKANLSEYIKSSDETAKQQNKEHYLFGNILVYIKDPLPGSVDIISVLNAIESSVPAKFVHGLDSVMIGHFDFFDESDTNAFYQDGAIYVTNDQFNEEDMIDDLVHEIAHVGEQTYGMDLYVDGALEEEFIGKRKKLHTILSGNGYNVPEEFSHPTESPEYSADIDEFLYEVVGYPVLTTLTMGLFISPYAATSLREYYANGFEEYFLGDKNYLKNISPMLYNKLEEITYNNQSQE